MHPFIRLVLVRAAGAGIGIGGVLVVQTVFGDIPAVLTAPIPAADCDEQFAALVENPVCQGKPRGWMRNFPVTTPVQPHAMPELSYEKKEERGGAVMPNDVGVLTSMLNTFIFVMTGGFARLWPAARWLLETLAIIEIALAALWWMLHREDIIAGLLQRMLWFGFFIWIVLHFPHLIDVVRDSFVQAGLTAGGTSITVQEFTNPSQIAQFGMIATEPIFQHIADYGAMGAMRNLGDIIVTGLAGLLIVLAFFLIAIQVFITLIEFYLFAVVGLLLVPFGVNRHTAFIAERVFSAVFAFGVKLMVLAFVSSIALPVLATLDVPPDPELRQILSLLLASLALAALTWHAPAIAAGLLAGTPSLTAGAATGALAAGAFGAAAVSSAGRSGAGVIAGGGRAAIGGAQGVTRIASTAGYAVQIGARNPDGGSFGRVGSAIRHVENVACSSAGRSIATSRVAQGFRKAVAQGRVAGQGGHKPSC